MSTGRLAFGITILLTVGTVYAVHRQRQNERFLMRRRILLELADQKELARSEAAKTSKVDT